MARLKEYYKNDVAKALMKKFSYKSVMQIPQLEKIVINVGAGEARDNSKVIDAILTDLSAITGQKPATWAYAESAAPPLIPSRNSRGSRPSASAKPSA